VGNGGAAGATSGAAGGNGQNSTFGSLTRISQIGMKNAPHGTI
jgi:hypothetical protein